MSMKSLEDDLMTSESHEGKLRLELRKLTNSDSWVSTAHESSTSNSRASTPLSLKSTGGRRGRPPKKHEMPKQHTSSNALSSELKSVNKPKKFRMVLEKDDDYEVDYISPDEGDSSSSSVCKDTLSVNSLSDTEFTSNDEKGAFSPAQSPHYWNEEKNSDSGGDDVNDDDDDDDNIPLLDLPKSSDDLLLPNNLVLPALQVYEILRHFRNSLRLSPFLFEDFCAALMSDETTVLLNECHITLLKTLLKEEESYGTLFVPLDQKDAHNVTFYFIDYLTWPEVVRSYVQSSPDFVHILPIVEEEKYPCVEASKKIKVLQFLTNMFLSSNKIRDELMMDGSIRYDDHCRVCHRLGDLLCCESCPAVYHLACCDPPLQEVPEEEWQCEVCLAHKLNGVSNCESESEINCQYLRHDPIGVDRFGRKYWFLVRRLFIENEDGVFYYTTYEEFKHVLSKLDHQKYEMVLCEALKDVLEEFPRQAKITEEVTNEACWKDDRKTEIEVLKENIRNLVEKENEEKDKELERENLSQQLPSTGEALEKSDENKQVDTNDTATESQTSEPPRVDTILTVKTTNVPDASSSSPTSSNQPTSSTSASLTASQTVTSLTVAPSLNVVQTPAATATSTAPAVLSTVTSAASRAPIQKTSFIPLSIKVPLTRCDAMIQPKQQPMLNQVLKINPKVQLKPAIPGSVTTLKNLFVLSKDGVKTPLTIGSDGKLTTSHNQRLIMINPTKTEPSTPQSRLSRELKRLQFAGAGPKMHKMTTPQLMKESESTSLNQDIAAKTKQTAASPQSPRKPFRLGEDGAYKQYKNYFVENTLALNKYQHKEEKDKERHVGYKFSLGAPVDFDWGGSLVGSRDDIVHTLRSTLFSLEQQVPLCFMHSRWEQYRKMWGRMLVQNDSVKAFAAVLGILEMAIRDNAKKTVWKEGLGQVRMRRLTPDQKEIHEKKKKHKLKVADDIAQRNAVWCKYPLPVKSNLVWKMRGEQYRVTGYGGWTWISTTFHCRNRKQEPKPFTLFKNFDSEKTKTSEADNSSSNPTETIEAEARKLTSTSDVVNVSKNLLVRSVVYNKRWNPSKVDKLLRWRILQEKERIQRQDSTKKDENDKESKENDPNSPPGSITSNPTPAAVTNDIKDPELDPRTSPVNESPEISDNEEVDGSTEEMSVDVDPHDESKKSPEQDLAQSDIAETVASNDNDESIKDESKEETSTIEEKTNEDTEMEVDDADNETKKEEDMEVRDEVTRSTSEDLSNEVVANEQRSEAESETNESTPSNDGEPPKENHVQESSPQLDVPEVETHESTLPSDDVEAKSPVAAVPQDGDCSDEQNEVTPSIKPTDDDQCGSPERGPPQSSDRDDNEKKSIPTSDNHDENISNGDHVKVANSPDSPSIDNSNRVPQSNDVIDGVRNNESNTEKPPGDGEMEVDVSVVKDEIIAPRDSSPASTDHQPPSSPADKTEQISPDRATPKSNSEVVAKVVTSVSTLTSTAVHEVKGDVMTETVTTTTVTSVKTVSSLKHKQQHSKHIRQSMDNVKQISTTAFDQCAGEAMETTQVYKISRRFRRSETHGVKRESSSSNESSLNIARTWKLVKSPGDSNKKKPSGVKMPIPWNFAVSKEGRKSIFRLPRSLVRHMALRGGLAWYPLGFRHVQKSATSLELFWPYRCGRPTIGTVWRYKLKNAKTLSSIAYLLRIIWHSMRWEDIVTKPSTDDVIHTICNDDDIVSIELLKRRNIGKSGLHSEYFVRRIVMPATEYDEEIPRSETYTPSSRSGLRTRSRQMNLRERSKKEVSLVQPKVETLWMSEDRIELWQIRQFDSMIRMQQKAAAAKKEAEAREAARAAAIKSSFPLVSARQKRELLGADRIDSANIEKLKAEAVKHITISPALLQQAAALHRSQASLTNNAGVSKIISLDLSQIGGKLATLTNPQVQGNLQKLAIKPSNVAASPQFVTIRASNAPSSSSASSVASSSINQGVIRTSANGGTFIQTPKIMPKKILIRQTGGVELLGDQKPKHPTIKLSGAVGPSKIQPLVATQISTKDTLVSPKVPMTQQSIFPTSGKPGQSMRVKLSANQLNDLIKLGPNTMAKVSINLADGTPGVGHLQIIPPGSQVTPVQGQQLMQCKVGNEVKRFLLTAAPTPRAGVQPSRGGEPGFTADSEVSLETPSLRHRLEQLQQRQQELIKPSLSNVHRFMTDKDPLWGGRTQHGDKSHLLEKRKEIHDRVKRKYTHSNESKEERQRRTVVQQVVKSLLDRIERKEELEARRRRREEREEMQKRKKEIVDMAKSQQRLHSRLLNALLRHEEQLKHDIRKRKSITEKHLTHLVENELHEDQLKRKKVSENMTSPSSRRANHIVTKAAANHVLTERNKKEVVKGASPKKMKRKRSPSPVENVQPTSPAKKKRKMINSSNSSDKLYCICQTPYDDTRFYIGCDLCMNWFHGECVGISERKAKHMDTWVCRDCQQTTPQEELYCICKTPYDDAQFYIGCDICQDWFHGRCVGISEDQADSIESYTCPRCKKETRNASREKSLSLREVSELTKIIRHLQNHKMAWPFLEPVREVDAPGYYKVITRPMDLQTVMKRLQCKYYTKLSDLVGDVSLIFDNCRQFNGPESNLVKCAEIVETVFVGKIRDMRGR